MTEDLEVLKSNPAILRLYGQYVSLRKEGNKYVGLCKFHAEKSGSFTVFAKDQGWKCFGCGKTGDIFSFIQELDKITFKEAVEKVKLFVGGGTKWEQDKAQVEAVFKPVMPDKTYITFSMDQYAVFEKNLANSKEGIEWLAGRGISLETAQRLHVGFTQDVKGKSGPDNKDINDKGWIVFPCIEDGKVVSIKYRSIIRKVFCKQPQMKTALFGVESIDIFEPVYLVEGELDRCAMEEAGFKAVSLASASSYPTPEQKDMLMQATCVFLAGDMDGAVGEEVMAKLWNDLEERTFMLKWPGNAKDANEFLLSCKDVDDFRSKVDDLTQLARTQPMPDVYSLQDIMLNSSEMKLSDHPNRLHMPWPDVDKMANLLPGSVLALYATQTGMGKALANGTGVLTMNGYRNIESLQIGDSVVGSDGKSTTVVGVFPQGIKSSYKVTFCDGSSVVCCDEHLWSVKDLWQWSQNKDWDTKSLRQIMDRGLRQGRSYQYHIPQVLPVQFPKKELPLDPYLLGSLLGDGGFRSHNLSFTTEDQEMLDQITPLLPEGVYLHQNVCNKINYNLSYKTGHRNPLRTILNNLGLKHTKSADKFVPDSYKYSSIEDRIAILQGLMDTDGCMTKNNSMHFCSVSEQLVEDVIFLTRSLGGNAKKLVQERPDGRKLLYYAYLKGLTIAPFRLPRKLARIRLRRNNPSRAITNIEKVDDVEMTCIAVDAKDKLFVTESFIVTHNTAFATQVCLHNAMKHGDIVVMYQCELSPEEIGIMVTAQLLRKNRNFITKEDQISAAKMLNGVQFYIWSNPSVEGSDEILDLLDKAVRRYGASLACIDHFHHLTRSSTNENAIQGAASKRIKTWAQKRQLKVINIGQPRKAQSNSKGKRTHVTDAKGNAAYADDADSVFAIHRELSQSDPNNPAPDTYDAKTLVHAQKTRSKGIGSAECYVTFFGAFAAFEQITESYGEPQ